MTTGFTYHLSLVPQQTTDEASKRCDKIYQKRMENDPQILETFGKRIQRCYGCFIAYHLKDMYLGEDVTFFCEHCRDDTMFHFDDFSRLMDISKLKEVVEAEHHH